jgi:filamentous hemagglutinin family protein
MTTKPDTRTTRKPRASYDMKLRRKALYLAVASCFSVTPAFAVMIAPPPTIIPAIASYSFTAKSAGMVTNEVINGSTRTIYTNDKAILNWSGGLNVNAGETLRFQQATDASKILNRIGGGNATTILGTLWSNGKVYLINNAGVVVGPGAHIETAGFVASSLNLSDDDFTHGVNRFTASTTNATGRVSNAGSITTTASGGFVYLIGTQVENSGIIMTPGGEAILAAGSSVELVDSADPSMRVKVSAKALPINLSQAMAQGGGNIFSVLNSGQISANSAVVGPSGKIQLRSAGTVTTTATSVLQARGDANTNGGLIRGFADTVGHYSGILDASGRNGGSIETSASFLYLDPGLSVAASALVAGGHSGKWLLDPYDFVIDQTAANTIQSTLNGGTSVAIETAYGGGPGNVGAGLGRITMANANIAVNYAGGVSLDFEADEKVFITNSSITGTGGEFDFTINAGQGVSIANSTIRTNGSGELSIVANSGNIGIVGSHLSATSPSASGSWQLVNIAAYSGSVNIDGSDINILNISPYAGIINILAEDGDVNIINQSQIGSISGDVYVDIAAYSGNVNIASSSIGVKTGSLGSSNVNIYASEGNITMLGADATHSIRAHEVDLTAEMAYGGGFGNIGQADHFIVTEADLLNVGDWQTNNAFVTDLGLLRNADIQAMNDAELQLQKGAFLNSSYGSAIRIDSNTALIASAGDIILDGSTIDFFSGSGDNGSYVIATTGGIILDNSSSIATHTSYGGTASLNLFATNLSLDHYSAIESDFVGLNYDIGGPNTDAAKRLALAAFAKNSTVNIGNGSFIAADGGVGMITGKMNIVGGAIISDNDLDLLVAGDLNLTGANGGYYSSFIGAATEAFITVGGHLNINTSPDGTSAASIEVGSSQTLFMNFPGTTKNGWSVDGVANAFDSTVLPGKTGIFVDGAPAVIGSNTFISYGSPKGAVIAAIANTRNNDLLTNPLGNSVVANNQNAADKFFSKDDDSKDEGDGKDGKKGKSKPKECS